MQIKQKLVLLMIIIGSLLLFSCSQSSKKTSDAKSRLSDYISKSFSVSKLDERMELAAFMTGPARNRLEAWSDDQFREAFIANRRQFLKLSIKEIKKISELEQSLSYEISYLDQNKGKDVKVTHLKTAQMLLQSGQWFIGEVRSQKELVEYKNEMSLP